MIVRTPAGNVELRTPFGNEDQIPLPGQAVGGWSYAGKRVTTARATGIPAALKGIRVLGETVGALPMIVYRDGDNGRDKARDAPQWDLLHTKPNDVQTPFGFKAFIAASIVGHGGAYVLKAKSRGKVQALYPLNPTRVNVKCVAGELLFRVRNDKGEGGYTDLTTRDVLYIPGLLLDDPYIGVSPFMVAANAVGTTLAVQEYTGRFFEGDATPSGVLQMPFGADTQQARDTREFWEDRHRGSGKAHRVGVLFGGATYTQVGLDAQSAQIIETQRWGVDEIARVLGLPAWVLGGTDQNPRSTPEQRSEDLVRFSILPLGVRIEEAFHADDDLFPDKDLFPELLTDGLMRADMAVRNAAYLQARQAGWLSVNDIRRKENEPPIGPEGDEYQFTPVGGAPNLQPGQGDKPAPAGGDPNAVEPQEGDA